MLNADSTIVAQSNPPGRARRHIIRCSGPEARTVASRFLSSDVALEPTARRVSLRLRGAQVPCLLLYFRAPASVTGQDVVEYHLPACEPLARALVEELVRAGCEHAGPGEFTARAFFNGKIDLAQAEAVAATIAADSEAALQAATRLRAGELSELVRPVAEDLAKLLALVEVGIDFAEEDISFIRPDELSSQAETLRNRLQQVLHSARTIEFSGEYPRVVLVGHPNAGKSTLLNLLAGFDRVVTSSVPGTTRDPIGVEVHLLSGVVRLMDTAGSESLQTKAEQNSENLPDIAFIEEAMQARAADAAAAADVLVLVRRKGDLRPDPALPRAPDCVVETHHDQLHSGGEGTESLQSHAIRTSSVTRAGLETLRARLDELCFHRWGGGGLGLTVRQQDLLAEAVRNLDAVKVGASAELTAHHLRLALDALGGISGEYAPDDVLRRIFAGFCIGK
jgi:tRNA modification GTPase